MEHKNYTVYMHQNKINGKKYIGITGNIPEVRWNNGKGYYKNPYFNHAIQKYGWDNFEHIILYEGLTKEEAEDLEIETIAKYDTTNSDNGYNLHHGGNLRNINHVYQYDRYSGKLIGEYTTVAEVNSKLGFYSEISDVCYGKRKTAHNFYWSYKYLGEYLSDELVKEINKSFRKPIAQYDLDGNFIRSYNSKDEASDILLGKNRGAKSITMQFRTSYGYIWRYADDDGNFPTHISKEDLEWILDKTSKRDKHVAQYDLYGKYIKSYKTIALAENETGINHRDISSCCKGKIVRTGKYFWRYIDDLTNDSDMAPDELELRIKKIKVDNRPILQYTKDGIFIKEYKSLADVSRDNNVHSSNVTKCCQGKIKTIGGYAYKYKHDSIVDCILEQES